MKILSQTNDITGYHGGVKIEDEVFIEMPGCKDCLHHNVCGYHITDETDLTVEECTHFKNKADYVEVKHGRWIWDDEDECWICSNCELSALNNYRGNSTESNYCLNCGTKMDR